MTRSRLRTGMILWFGLALSLPAFSAPPFEPDYETLHAASILPGRTLATRDYRIFTEVVNRGLMNHYEIASRYGPMSAHGDLALQKRLKEIQALKRLYAMHEGLLVAKSIGDTVWQTAKSAVRVATDPRGAAEGLQRGIERLLRRAGRKLRNAYESIKTSVEGDAAEGQTKEPLSDQAAQAGRTFVRNRLGVNRAYRRLAREVGVDPYTDNEILRFELDRLAKHAAGASVGSKLMIPRIPGVIGAVDNVSALVWDKDRLDLLLHNEDTLKALSIPESIVSMFISNESYSPTHQTAITTALASMKGVHNLSSLVEVAAAAEGASEADFYSNMIGLLSLYHHNRSRLIRVRVIDFVPAVYTGDGRMVVAFPVDRLRWTRGTATMVSILSGSSIPATKYREFWVTGVTSPSAERRLVENGWTPFIRAHHRLGCMNESMIPCRPDA